MSNSTNETIQRAGKLCWKRYMGQDMSDNDLLQFDTPHYIDTFLMAGIVKRENILIAEDILNELNEIADKKGVDLSTLISLYVLEMLERNYPTKVSPATGKTKGKERYIINNLYDGSNFMKYAESKERVVDNIFSNKQLERKLTYDNNIVDEYLYITDYLKSNGYTEEQIYNIQKEELDTYGKIKNCGIDMIKPYSFETEYKFNVEAFNIKSIQPVYVSVRLGLHYIIMKHGQFNKYGEVENYIIHLLNGHKVWDLYKDLLQESFMEVQIKGGEKAWDLYKEFLEKNPL